MLECGRDERVASRRILRQLAEARLSPLDRSNNIGSEGMERPDNDLLRSQIRGDAAAHPFLELFRRIAVVGERKNFLGRRPLARKQECDTPQNDTGLPGSTTGEYQIILVLHDTCASLRICQRLLLNAVEKLRETCSGTSYGNGVCLMAPVLCCRDRIFDVLFKKPVLRTSPESPSRFDQCPHRDCRPINQGLMG